MIIAQSIKSFFKGDVADDEATLLAYAHDASLFEIKPDVVVFPKDSDDIKQLVLWVAENKKTNSKLSLTVRGAGTCMSGGAINDSIIIDTTRYMTNILEVKSVTPYTIKPKFENSQMVEVTGEARVQPGCFYRDFEKVTFEKELLLPCFTASKSLNTVGGMVGNNSGGELTLRYGKTEDYVKELKVILADGNEYTFKPLTRRELYVKIAEPGFEGDVYRSIFNLIKDNEDLIKKAKPHVSKNSAGYMLWHILTRGKSEEEDIFDLSQIIIGAQGTLGIVTEIVFRLVSKQKKSKLLVVFMNDLSKIGEVTSALLSSGPISIESYDDKTFSLAVRFFKDFVKSKGFFKSILFGISFIPEFFMVLTGGVPKLVLLSEYAGSTEKEIDDGCKRGVAAIKQFGYKIRITRSEHEAEKYWDMRRDSFNLLRKHVKGMRTAPFIDDVIVRPEFLAEFLPKLNALIAEYPSLIYTIAGHAENGNFHIIPLVDPNDPKLPDIVLDLSKKVYDLVLSYGGSIDAEHNDGIIRSPFLPQMYGKEVYGLFEKTKAIFDQTVIFNPKKKVGTTFEDIRTFMGKPHPDVPHAS